MANEMPVQVGGGFSSARPAPPERSRSTDAHLGLRFWVELGQVEIAGFRECSPLTVETEMFEYAEGGLNSYTHKLPVRTKYANITLKRGMNPSQDLFQWYIDVMNGKIQRQNISISIYDTRGRLARRYDLRNAYPSKWTGPDLKTDAGAIAVESIEFAHEGLLPTSIPDANRPK